MFDGLLLGAQTAFSLNNLLYASFGCLLGTLIGVIPGIGPLSAIAILLPLTYTLEPSTALIMLAAIYYGSQYGGSTTAILLNLPGEATSAVTALDGNAMARQGKAGQALAVAALSSFMAGCITTLIIAMFAPMLSRFAVSFTSVEYFSLMVAGLCAAMAMSSGSIVKLLGMTIIGLVLGLVGTDVNSGLHRFTFGVVPLWDGLDIVAVTIGLFAITELVVAIENPERRTVVGQSVGRLMLTWQELKTTFMPALRGTGLGTILGVLPGGGALISSFASYALERQVAKDPDTFGKGRIEGVAGPEAANNAGAQASFVPMLTLGIPGNALIAVLLGALIIHGVPPGPRLIESHPEIFWGVIVSMWAGNLILVLLNLPLVGLWAKLLQIPFGYLYPGVVLFCCVGIYGASFTTFPLFVAAALGVSGYVFRKLNCDVVPLIMGFVLGPMLEENFRRSMNLNGGDPSIFVTRPLSLALLILAAFVLALAVLPAIRSKREMLDAQ